MARTPGRLTRRGIVTGYLFKLIRESIPRSQEALAVDLQVDRGTVQGWESGRRPFTAVPFGQAVSLRHRLAVLGADTALLDAIDIAAEADYLISHIMEVRPEAAGLSQHPLGWTVMTHPLAEMLAWPLTGRAPQLVAHKAAGSARRGPVARAPLLHASERQQFFDNLRVLADRARQQDGPTILLRRQSCFLAGLDRTGHSSDWLRDAKGSHRYFFQSHGWSPLWPDARSVATSLARQGDPEPLRDFISHAHPDDTCELAGLNYWAYWVGEIPDKQRDDQFMIDSGHRWRGNRLLKHIVDRLDASHGFRDLYIHTLWALLVARPGVLHDDPTAARSLYSRAERLLDEGSISTQSRQELTSVLYGMRVEGWGG